MSLLNIGLQTPVLSLQGVTGQVYVNGVVGPVNGNVTISLDPSVTGNSSSQTAALVATGALLYGYIVGGDTNLSGSLVSMSGQLVTQIQSAAGVLSLNGATGLLTLGGTNGVSVSVSGTTLWLSGTSGFNAATYATIANLALTGQQAWSAADNNARNLSGALTASGSALIALITGAAADVNSINGATGDITLISAPANANYVKVSTSGTTIYVSGDTTPLLSGVSFAGGATLSGGANDLFLSPGATLGIGSSVDFNNGVLQLATHTTSGAGLGLGPDNSIWRTAANQITYNGTLSLTGLVLPGSGNISGNAGTIYLDARSGAEIRTISGDMNLGAGLIAQGSLTAISAGFNGGIGTVVPNIAVVGGQFSHGGLAFTTQGNVTDYKAVISAGIAGGGGQGVMVVYAGGGSSQTRLFDFNGNTNNTNTQNVSYARLLVGSATQLVNGFLQLATHTTSGNGIALGPTVSLWSAQTANLATQSLFTTYSGIQMGSTGDYTLSGAASVAQLFAVSGWLTNSATSNVVYITGVQTVGGTKSFTGPISAQSYSVSVSGVAIPLIGASATGTYNVDFTNSPGLQTLTVTGATLISGINYTNGGAVTMRINVSGANAAALRFPATWNAGWVTTVPTGIATGRFAVLTLNTFAAAESGLMIAYAVAP